MGLSLHTLRIVSDRKWWVTKLESSRNVTVQGWEKFPNWPSKEIITAYLQYAPQVDLRGWALDSPAVIRDIVNWCQDNCTKTWKLGETEQVYFECHEEAMLFLLNHGKPNTYG